MKPKTKLSLASIVIAILALAGVLLVPQVRQRLELEPEPTPQIGSTTMREADGMVMVYVPGDTFLMGSDEGRDDEQPVHSVTLDSFWMDRTEVSNAQYALCVAAGHCETPAFADDTHYNGADYPVVGVSWQHAVDYCAWVGARLPTEAEWEYAACGPDEKRSI